MSNYIINYTDSAKNSFVVGPGVKDNTHLDITMLGSSSVDWGEELNENLVHMLENFANSAAPSSPIEGQLWFDNVNNALFIYTAAGWVRSNGIVVDSTSPSSPHDGDLWWDTTVYAGNTAEDARNLHIYIGGSWEYVVDDYLPRDGRKAMLGDIDMNSNTIVNLAQPAAPLGPNTPADPTQAATTQYVHDRFIDTQGDTMTGDLNLDSNLLQNVGDPVTGTDGMSRNYADSRYVNVTGDVMSGGLSITTGDLIISTGKVRIETAGDVGIAPISNTHGLQIGADTSENIAIDGDEIMARNNGVVSTLFINQEGGTVQIGSTGTVDGLTVHGNITGKDQIIAESNLTCGGFDFYLGNTDQATRGDSGQSRALVKSTSTSLVINYAGDFSWTEVHGAGLRINPAGSAGTGAPGDTGDDSVIGFWDSNSSTYRYLYWNDSTNSWYVTDNTGTAQLLYHAGNLPAGAINNDAFDVTGGTGTSQAINLTGYSTSTEFVIIGHGFAQDRGTSSTTMYGSQLWRNGAVVGYRPNQYINWPDGNPPVSASWTVAGGYHYSIRIDSAWFCNYYTVIRIK